MKNLKPPSVVLGKRKTEDDLISATPKKICTQMNGSTKPNDIASCSNTTLIHSAQNSDSSEFEFVAVINQPTLRNTTMEVENFEYSAVKPVKRVFVSRLPADLSYTVLRRHILKRLPGCETTLDIAWLPG